jgi:hypothetical protein
MWSGLSMISTALDISAVTVVTVVTALPIISAVSKIATVSVSVSVSGFVTIRLLWRFLLRRRVEFRGYLELRSCDGCFWGRFERETDLLL